MNEFSPQTLSSYHATKEYLWSTRSDNKAEAL